LGYKEVKANTVTQSLIIEEDLQAFIAESSLNEKPYEVLLKKYKGDKKALLQDLMALLAERIASSRNMALFINANKSVAEPDRAKNSPINMNKGMTANM
jgi:type I restriction enzyme R subunit